MKWKRMIWATAAIVVLLAMGLTGCPSPAGGGGGESLYTGGGGGGKTALKVPTNLEISDVDFTLTWTGDANAASYTILVGNLNLTIPDVTGASYLLGNVPELALTLVPHSHMIQVKAVVPPTHATYTESGYSVPFYFETATYVFETDENGTITGLTEYGETLEKIVIPESIDGEEVTEIAEGAFEGNEKLEEVLISKTVVKIGKRAFKGNSNLNKVSFYRTKGDETDITTLDDDDVFEGCEDITFYVPLDSEDEYKEVLGDDATVETYSKVSGITYHWLNEGEMIAQASATSISRASGDTLIITPADGYSPIGWYVNSVPVSPVESSYTFTVGNKSNGNYSVGLVADKNGKIYNVNITITVTD